MNPAKVLFLDIDGVLNSRRSVVAFRGFPHGFDAKNMAMFDPVAIGLIKDCARKVTKALRAGRPV